MNLLLDLDEVLVHMRLVTEFTVVNPAGWIKNVVYRDTQGQVIRVDLFD